MYIYMILKENTLKIKDQVRIKRNDTSEGLSKK